MFQCTEFSAKFEVHGNPYVKKKIENYCKKSYFGSWQVPKTFENAVNIKLWDFFLLDPYISAFI